MDLQLSLQLAFGDHQAGRLESAELGYKEILKQVPAHPDALNLLGVLCSQKKDFPSAISLLLQAVAAKPEFTDAWLNLAKTFSSALRLQEAAGACDVVLRINPLHAEALATQARTLRKLKQYAAALTSARALLAIKPDSLEMGRLEAACLVELREYDEALNCFERWLVRTPRDQALSNDYAMLLVRLDRKPEAIQILESLVGLPEPFLPACSNLGNVLYDQGEHDRAMDLHRIVVSKNPKLYAGWINYANILQKQENLADARDALQKAVDLQPNRSEAYVNLSSVLMAMDQETLAHETLTKAITLTPDFVDAWNNLGAMELDAARPDMAQQAYSRAVQLSPALAAAQFGLSLSYLMQGNFVQGWPLYEWRWFGASQSKPQERPRFSCPQWKGQPTQHQTQTIVIYHEQGFGDTIQFLRFIPLLREKFAQIVLIVQPQLHELVRNNVPIEIQVLSSEQGQAVVRTQSFSWHCPMGSLPLACGLQNVQQIPGVSGYLRPLHGHRLPPVFEKSLLHAKSNNMRVIGLCWAGNPGLAHNKTRSLALSMLNELVQTPGVFWVSLQRDRSENDAEILRSWNVLDMSSCLNDFADTAGIMKQLDLVISVDTVVVHLAGALGVPCWLINRFQSEWRWMHGHNNSVWYASVKQWRQSRKKQWSDVLLRLGAALVEQVSVGNFHQENKVIPK